MKDLILRDEREPASLELSLDLCFHGEEDDCAEARRREGEIRVSGAGAERNGGKVGAKLRTHP